MNKLLIKFPTRQRAMKLFNAGALRAYQLRLTNLQTRFLFTLDADDTEMNNPVALEKIKAYGNSYIEIGQSTSKIHAVNRDLEKYTDYDVILLASDDMIPIVDGYDDIILNDMQEAFPDTNGCLWYSDGKQDRICTLTVMGRKYYKEKGYLYHPSYKSLWCDNELTDVAVMEGKMKKINRCIIEHRHPAWGGGKMDRLYARNDKFWTVDEQNYNERKKRNFDLIGINSHD